MIPDPQQYPSYPVYDLLKAAGKGYAGMDHRLLHAIVDRGQEAVPDLLRYYKDSHDDEAYDLTPELLAIFRHLQPAEALSFYLDVLRDDPTDMPDDLPEALQPFAKQALEPLLGLAKELDEDQRGDVLFLLASLGQRDERILALLLEQLEFDMLDSLIFLGLYGDPSALAALQAKQAELTGSSEQEGEVRQEIDRTIRDLEAVPTMPLTPPEKFDLWEQYPALAQPDVEVLPEADRLEMLQAGSAELRAAAAASFFNKDLAKPTQTALHAALQTEQEPEVRARLWEALGLGVEDPALLREMRERLQRPDLPSVERAGLLVALSLDIETEQERQALDLAYQDPATRAKALEAMWRSLDKRYAERVSSHIADEDPEIKRQAVWGIGYLGVRHKIKDLEKLFEDEELRQDALFAYALALPADISPGRVKGLLNRISERAGNLSEAEVELVKVALDERLQMNEYPPVFFRDEPEP